MKKLFAVGVISTLCLSAVCVSAQTVALKEITFDKKIITVSGSVKNQDNITLLVVKKDKSPETEAVAVDEKCCGGDFEFVFEMPDNILSAEEFSLYLTSKDGDFENKDFKYVSVGVQENLIEYLKTSSDIVPILDNTDNYVAAVSAGIHMDLWSSMNSQMKSTAAALVGDEADYVAELNKALDFVMFNNAQNSAASLQYSESLNFSWQNEKFSDMSAERKEVINNELFAKVPYVSYADMENVFNEINGVYDIKRAKTGELEALLKKYASILDYENDSSYKSYEALSNKSTANDKIVRTLSARDDYTISNVMSVIATAVKGNGSSGGVSGSGGSSGGGGTSSGVTGGTAPVVTVTEQEEETKSFSDINSVPWASEAIVGLANKNVISGYEDGTFLPNGTVTREEFVTMIIRAAKLNTTGVFCDFADVDHDAWYYPFVASAYTNNILSGMGNGKIGIGENITRQDMAVILDKTMTRMRQEPAQDTAFEFSDYGDTADYAKESVEKLAAAGIIKGSDGKFNPYGKLTRAEAAVVIYKLFDE